MDFGVALEVGGDKETTEKLDSGLAIDARDFVRLLQPLYRWYLG